MMSGRTTKGIDKATAGKNTLRRGDSGTNTLDRDRRDTGGDRCVWSQPRRSEVGHQRRRDRIDIPQRLQVTGVMKHPEDTLDILAARVGLLGNDAAVASEAGLHLEDPLRVIVSGHLVPVLIQNPRLHVGRVRGLLNHQQLGHDRIVFFIRGPLGVKPLER